MMAKALATARTFMKAASCGAARHPESTQAPLRRTRCGAAPILDSRLRGNDTIRAFGITERILAADRCQPQTAN